MAPDRTVRSILHHSRSWLLNHQIAEIQLKIFDITNPSKERSKMKKAIISSVLILAIMTFANSHVQAESIRLTDIPDYGAQHDLLRGKVEGTATPTDYKVAVYILVDGMGWYIKPYVDSFVFPDLDGNWTCNIVTGGVDQYAIKITAYLLPGDYSPPQRSRETDEENAIDKTTATRSARIISFSGYDWAVKSSVEGSHTWPVGPGQNYFSASSENVWVDEQGRLHLKITKNDGKWYCAEIRCLEEFGYGTYHFYLSSGFEQMINQNENVVLGLFTYDDEAPPPYREMTIEYAKWGDPEAANGQFVVQPPETVGNKQRFTFPYTGQDSKHSFKWGADEIGFEASYDGTVAASWTYTGNDIPDHGNETVRMNLWLCDKEGPGEQSEVEVVIERFEFAVTMALPKGWSMISLPVIPDNASVAALFPDAVVVYGFEKSLGYVRKETLEAGQGYWILVNEAQSYTLTGKPIESYIIPIDADGWLMIGGCTEPAKASVDTGNIGVIYKFTQEFGYQRVLASESLERGQGYWVLINDATPDGTISVETVD
jgi:hypothetical protein